MNAQLLSTRLQTLLDAHRQTVHLIHRLSKLPAGPGSSPLSLEAGDARSELGSEIHQSLKEQDEEFELIRQEIENQTGSTSWTHSSRRRDSESERERERERTDLAAQVTQLGEDLKLARSQFRKAQLQAKRNAEAAKRKERESLFADIQEGNLVLGHSRRRGQEQLSKEQQELNASVDVTAGLRRIQSLMQTEVSKSQFALETLHQSTTLLSSLSENYSNLDTLLSSSRSLVSSLLHSQKSDTWYLESAFWILVITIAWLVFRRILYGPTWWLIYLPITLGWRSTIIIVQLLLGASASIAGVLGGTSQSTTLSQASEQVSTSLIVKPSSTGDLPKFNPAMSAPSIQVGGGGKGQPAPRRSDDGEDSMSEKIGTMAEKSSQTNKTGEGLSKQDDKGTTLRERQNDEPPNPKKRMWEENTDSEGRSSTLRDEL